MSVSGYFNKFKPELKMSPTPNGADTLGIRYQGPVLSGLLGVQHQLQNHAASSPQTSAQIREIAPGGLNYLPPAATIHPGQDPRLHPDPVRAAQRDRLGNRPELYDPVLRFHTGRPPLPDAREAERRRAEHWRQERLKHVIP